MKLFIWPILISFSLSLFSPSSIRFLSELISPAVSSLILPLLLSSSIFSTTSFLIVPSSSLILIMRSLCGPFMPPQSMLIWSSFWTAVTTSFSSLTKVLNISSRLSLSERSASRSCCALALSATIWALVSDSSRSTSSILPFESAKLFLNSLIISVSSWFLSCASCSSACILTHSWPMSELRISASTRSFHFFISSFRHVFSPMIDSFLSSLPLKLAFKLVNSSSRALISSLSLLTSDVKESHSSFNRLLLLMVKFRFSKFIWFSSDCAEAPGSLMLVFKCFISSSCCCDFLR